MPSYFVAQAKPRQEIRASLELARQDYAVYIPWSQVTKVRNRRLVTINEPYYPSYIFPEKTDNWGPIRNTFGIQRLLLSPSNIPYELSEEIIDAIKARVAYKPPIEITKGFEPDQRVRVRDGVLAGLEGLFQKSAQGRTMALLDTLRGKVQIPLANLEAVAL